MRLIFAALGLIRIPFKVFSGRTGCLILVLLAALLFITCGMLGRLTLVI